MEPVDPPAPTVELIREDGFWSVLLQGKDIGWIERSEFEDGYTAVAKGTNYGEHFYSLSAAKAYLVREAI